MTDDGARADHLLPDRRDHASWADRRCRRRRSRSTIRRRATLRSSGSRRRGWRPPLRRRAARPRPGASSPRRRRRPRSPAGAGASSGAGRPRAYLAVMERAPVDVASRASWTGGRRARLPASGSWSRARRRSSTTTGAGRGRSRSYLDVEAGDSADRRPRVLGVGLLRATRSAGARRRAIDVATLRVGVLVQPFLAFDAGGTARVDRDGGSTSPWRRAGRRAWSAAPRRPSTFGSAADGTIDDEQELASGRRRRCGGGRRSRGVPPRPSAPA